MAGSGHNGGESIEGAPASPFSHQLALSVAIVAGVPTLYIFGAKLGEIAPDALKSILETIRSVAGI